MITLFRKASSLYIILSLLTAATAADVKPKSLLANGDFESVLSTGWGTGQYAEPGRPVWWTSNNCKATAAIDPAVRHAGKSSLHIINRSAVSPNTYGTTQQRITIIPNQKYKISLWAKANRLASPGAVSVIVDKQWKVRPVSFPVGTYDWKLLTGEFSLPDNTADVRILIENSGEVWIDDITVEPVVAPKTPAVFSNISSEFTVLYSESADVAAVGGGSLQTSDGVLLSFIPGSLNRNAKVTIKKSTPKNPADIEPVIVYDVDLNGAVVSQPVTLKFPITIPPEFTDLKDISVFHFNKQKARWQRLPSTVAPDRKSITCQTRDFSPFIIPFLPEWIYYYNYFNKQRNSPGKHGPLKVPYYSQGDYGWCWAASLAMVNGFRGHNTKIWEIASYFSVDKNEGMCSPGSLSSYLKSIHPEYKIETKMFWHSKSLNGYLMTQIDQGNPVWIGIPYAGHAVVVVGYDNQGIYVHDPSGRLLSYTMGIAAANTTADQGKLGSYHIPWDIWGVPVSGDWQAAAIMNSASSIGDSVEISIQQTYSSLIFPSMTLVVKEPAAAGKSVSLQLLPVESFDIQRRVDLYDIKRHPQYVNFTWEGRDNNGYRFECKDKLSELCNSDEIKSLNPYISNTSEAAQTALVRIWLDQTEIISKELTLPADLVNRRVSLSEFKKPLNLRSSALALGFHTFSFELIQGKSVIDRADIVFTVAPEIVNGVTVRIIDEETIEIKWSPNREERLFGAALSYNIYKSFDARSFESANLIAEMPPGVYKYKLKVNKEDLKANKNFYSVKAYHSVSNLISPEAIYVKPEKEKKSENFLPLFPGTKLEYTYDMSGIMNLLQKSGDGSMQNYKLTQSEVWEVGKSGEVAITSYTSAKGTTRDENNKPVTFDFFQSVATRQSFERRENDVVFGDATIMKKAWGSFGSQKVDISAELALQRSSPQIIIAKPVWPEAGTSWRNDFTQTVKLLYASGNTPDGKLNAGMDELAGGSVNLTPGTVAVKTTHTVTVLETVTVPAGKFDNCSRVEITAAPQNQGGVTVTTKIIQWYANTIGLVKEESRQTITVPGEAPIVIIISKVLKKYEIP